ncbi:MAG: inositol monophosphatase [Lachnospiraceae bacterium]|nr:inositol monophosphatase [Lachnospiraceae bacterium]
MAENENLSLALKVCDIARKASGIMKNRPKQSEITQKGNASNYVTESDIAVQSYVTEGLLKLLPESVVVGEESREWKHEGRDIWVIDPIDGTSNFIRDLGASVISIALVRNGELQAGIIYNPYRDEMFYGARGCGAYCNGERLYVSDRDFAHSHLCSAMSLYDKRFAKPCLNIIGRVYDEADDLRRFGSAALELAQLAAGRVELYFEMRISPWDVAAGALLIEEAGGYWECLYDDGFQIDKIFPFVAANSKENFERLRRIIAEEVPQVPYNQDLRATFK